MEPLGISFSFDALVVVVYPMAVGAQDYAFFNFFVGFGKLSVRYELMYAAFFCTGVFVVKVHCCYMAVPACRALKRGFEDVPL